MNSGRFYGSLQSRNQSPTHGHDSRIAERAESALDGDHSVGFLNASEIIANNQDHMNTAMICDEINKEVKNLRMEVATIKRTMDNFNKENRPCHTPAIPKTQKLPKNLSKIVRQLHENMESKFEPSELFCSVHNQSVASEMEAQLVSQNEVDYPKDTIKRAVHRFYESRRRSFNDAKPGRRQQVLKNSLLRKMRGYQKRLYIRRAKALLNAKERKRWGEINECYMTEESEDEEEGIVRRHHLPWESDALKNAKSVLDRRTQSKKLRSGQFGAKPKVESIPSTLPIPHNPVKWVIKRDTPDSALQGSTSNYHDCDVQQESPTMIRNCSIPMDQQHRSENGAFIRHATMTPTMRKNTEIHSSRALSEIQNSRRRSLRVDSSTPHRHRESLQPTVLSSSSHERNSETQEICQSRPRQQTRQVCRFNSDRLDAEAMLDIFDNDDVEFDEESQETELDI